MILRSPSKIDVVSGVSWCPLAIKSLEMYENGKYFITCVEYFLFCITFPVSFGDIITSVFHFQVYLKTHILSIIILKTELKMVILV